MRTTNGQSAICILSAIVLVTGCDGQTSSPPPASPSPKGEASVQPADTNDVESTVTGKQVQQEVQEAADAVQQFSAQQTKQVLEDAQTELDEAKLKAAELKKRLGSLAETAQTNASELLNRVDDRLAETEERLEALRQTGDEAWDEAHDDLRKALEHLTSAYEEAANVFQTPTDDSLESPKAD